MLDSHSKAMLIQTAEIWEAAAERYDRLGSLGQAWLDKETKGPLGPATDEENDP